MELAACVYVFNVFCDSLTFHPASSSSVHDCKPLNLLFLVLLCIDKNTPDVQTETKKIKRLCLNVQEEKRTFLKSL